ncbi:MAG: hypothetical protein GEU93_04175 [Propionibacteriales bacterium]|nr:hypothetical protein [Propionibacteriales bacterium]
MANGNGYISVGLSSGRDSRVDCHVYDDGGPILCVDGTGVHLTVAPNRREGITEDDVRFARTLSEAVATYRSEVERWYEQTKLCPWCGHELGEDGECHRLDDDLARGADSHATA